MIDEDLFRKESKKLAALLADPEVEVSMNTFTGSHLANLCRSVIGLLHDDLQKLYFFRVLKPYYHFMLCQKIVLCFSNY